MTTPTGTGPARATLSAAVLFTTLGVLGGAANAQHVERDGKAVVDAVCISCHGPGKDGAPRIGDRPAWTPRLAKGLEALVASAIHGHGPMPARGGLADLNDREMRHAIVYMFNAGLPDAVPPSSAAPADPHHKVVSGTDIYLGLMRAEAIRAAQADEARTGAAKAARIPSGKGYYHVNISLVDHGSQVPVTDADVKVRTSDGMTTESKVLGLVVANRAVSYGNYFHFTSGNAYNITAEIRRPGVVGPIQARFDFKAP
jgi:cytochrome c5